jgi:hypothetical protein
MRIPAAIAIFRRPHQPIGLSLTMLMAIVFLTISSTAYTQSRYDWRTNIDQVMHETDSLSLKSQRTFYLNKILRKDEPLKETWYYTEHNNNVIVFEVRYRIDSLEYTETYYLNRGRLICMELYETDFLSYYEDEIKSGEVFFFDHDMLIQYVTVGNGLTDMSFRDPQYEPLRRFYKRYIELQKNILALATN